LVSLGISKQVKLKNVCILPVWMGTYCAMRLKNALGHTTSNDFIETTLYGRTLPSFSFAERTCVAIFFLRWPVNMLQVCSYRLLIEIHELPRKKLKKLVKILV